MRRETWRTLAAAFAVALVNIALVSPLFRVEYTDQMQSIEAAFISLARYILDHFPDLRWFPLWYTGIPYQNTYPPLLPLSVAALAAVARIPPGLAYHALTAALYCLGPVALFWLVHRLSGSRTQALFAALAWSLISPSCFLIPEVRRDALNYLRRSPLPGTVGIRRRPPYRLDGAHVGGPGPARRRGAEGRRVALAPLLRRAGRGRDV